MCGAPTHPKQLYPAGWAGGCHSPAICRNFCATKFTKRLTARRMISNYREFSQFWMCRASGRYCLTRMSLWSKKPFPRKAATCFSFPLKVGTCMRACRHWSPIASRKLRPSRSPLLWMITGLSCYRIKKFLLRKHWNRICLRTRIWWRIFSPAWMTPKWRGTGSGKSARYRVSFSRASRARKRRDATCRCLPVSFLTFSQNMSQKTFSCNRPTMRCSLTSWMKCACANHWSRFNPKKLHCVTLTNLLHSPSQLWSIGCASDLLRKNWLIR